MLAVAVYPYSRFVLSCGCSDEIRELQELGLTSNTWKMIVSSLISQNRNTKTLDYKSIKSRQPIGLQVQISKSSVVNTDSIGEASREVDIVVVA